MTGDLNLNWVDLVIILVFLFYAFEGMAVGLVRGILDFGSFILSFALALKFYTTVGVILVKNFSLPHGIANAIGFFIAAFLFELIFGLITAELARKVPKQLLKSPLNLSLGFVPGLLTALVLVAFFITIILTLPLSPVLKDAVLKSQIGGYLTSQTQRFEKNINQVFGQGISETINFLTIRPQGRETVDLNFRAQTLTPDPASEQRMFEMVNQERGKVGLARLTFDNRLHDVARLHAEDMLKRGYFSHYTPEGLSPFDRLTQADISFNVAGENLALAPSTELAHRGLMESEGHRKNILSGDFGRVGIGIIDGGIYGKMFVQEFTD